MMFFHQHGFCFDFQNAPILTPFSLTPDPILKLLMIFVVLNVVMFVFSSSDIPIKK